MKIDQIDYNRAEVHVVMYLLAEVKDHQVHIFPQVHGIYETWFVANNAIHNMNNPKDYYISSGRWIRDSEG